MDNLNEFLNAKSCLNTRPDSQNSFQFDVNTDRGAVGNAQIRDASITSAKIKNLNFSQGTGGTLTLGGTLDGNGVLSVQNQTGTEVVRLDNSGMTVTNGSIIIKNVQGSNIIDSTGLVSTNNFVFDSKYSSGNVVGTTYTPLTNGTLNPIILTRNTVLFFSLDVYGLQSNIFSDFGVANVFAFDGTTPIIGVYLCGNAITSGGTNIINGQEITSTAFVELGAGTHTLITKCGCEFSSGTAIIVEANLSYMKYGN